MCHRVNKTFQKFPKSESSNSHHLSTSSSLWRSRPQTWAQLLRCIFPPWRPSQRVLDPNSSFPKLHSSCSSLTRLSSNSNLHWAPPPPYDEAAATSSSCSFSACTTPFIVLAPLEHLLLLPLTTDGRLCSRHLLLHLASHQFATSSSLQEPAFQCGATYHQLPYLHLHFPFPKWFLSNSNSSIHPTGSSQNLPPEPERKIRSFYVAIIIPFLSLQSKSIKIQHSLANSGTCHFGDNDLKWLMIHPGGSATTCSHKQRICHRINYSNTVCST